MHIAYTTGRYVIRGVGYLALVRQKKNDELPDALN